MSELNWQSSIRMLINWMLWQCAVNALYLLIFPFCLQRNLLMGRTFWNATLAAHSSLVLLAVIHKRFFMAVTQEHSSPSFTSPHERLPTGRAGGVCGLCQNWQRDVAFKDGPAVELFLTDGALRSDISLALGVPVKGDALLTEGVSTGKGYRDPETLHTYGTDQVGILRLHHWRKTSVEKN